MRWAVGFALLIAAAAPAQTGIATGLDRHDLATLERLVSVAQLSDPTIAGIIALQRSDALALERLKSALSLTISGSVAGDIYGQAAADYRIGIGLDLLELLPDPEQQSRTGARLAQELRRVRLVTVEAFVRHRVAVERAAVAALELESAEIRYRALRARHQAGDVILAEVLAARSALGGAALALLAANGEVVIALEALAAAIGRDTTGTRQLLGAP